MDNYNIKLSSDLKENKNNEVELYEAFSIEELEERLDLKSSSSSSSKCPLLAAISKCRYF